MAGGKRGSSPSPVRNFPGKRCGCSEMLLPPQPAFALAFPHGSVRGCALQALLDLPFPALSVLLRLHYP